MNIARKLAVKFPELTHFKVTQAWIEFGELYIVSEFDVPNDLFDKCEDYAVEVL